MRLKIFLILLLININVVADMTTKHIDKILDNLFDKHNQQYYYVHKNEYHIINMRFLLEMTIMCESHYGKYPLSKNNVAVGICQVEPETAEWVYKAQPELKATLEKQFCLQLNLKMLKYNQNNIITAYMVYLTKYRYHSNLLRDIDRDGLLDEWDWYKIYYNSTAGKATKRLWNNRINDYYKMENIQNNLLKEVLIQNESFK